MKELPKGTLRLNKKWVDCLTRQGETGMGYQVVTVVLKNGQHIERVVVIQSELVSSIHGRQDGDHIPFANEDIADIIVTHDKWDFETGREIGELPHP